MSGGRRCALAGIALSAYLGAGVTRAHGAPPQDARTEVPRAAREVYDGTMSPFCPGLLLANCPSPQADSLRRAIAARAAAGESRAHIEADLLATYGEVVRAAPPRRGFGLVAWLAPAALLAAAGAWVTHWSRRSAGRGTDPAVLRHRADRTAGTPHDAPGGAPDGMPTGSAGELAALDALLRRG